MNGPITLPTQRVKSPFAEATGVLCTEPGFKLFRKQSYSYLHHFYQCEHTTQRFSTSSLDEINQNQVYNQYRERYHVLFPEQIRELRQQYGLSASRMSDLFNFGINQYRAYEDGEVPSESNAAHLRLARNPRTFREMVLAKVGVLRPTEFSKLEQLLREKIYVEETRAESSEPYLPPALVNPKAIPTQFNGYVVPKADKFAEMVLFFFAKLQHLYAVKLWKLMFYADFYHYRLTGRSISGYRYQAIQHGPVPERYEMHIGMMIAHNQLQRQNHPSQQRTNGMGSVIQYFPVRPPQMQVFTDSEVWALQHVFQHLGYKTRVEIEALSHAETAWIANHPCNGPISYQTYAYDLKALTLPEYENRR